jgi:sugar diacid utilization regulator/putative methionine-R-sulfoxide reductase with GAF domain
VAGEPERARGSDVARLASVRRVSDERAYLYELIQTIGAGPDLDAILRGVVRLVTEATTCHACFVYFLRDDRLTLRAASAMYEHLEGQVRIPVGEGLTGWVAKTRRAAYIKEGALDDPRVRRAYFPALGDEVYQSLVSVPIFSRAGAVSGVITLHAEAPHEFARSDLDFLEHTASLITGAVENARLYEEATERVALLVDLSRLSQRIAAATDQDELLDIVTSGVRSLLGASECEIRLHDTEGRPRLVARNSANDDPIVRAHGSVDEGGVKLTASLVAGDERLGQIEVRLPVPNEDAGSALAAVAAHTAVALKQHEVVDRLREKNLLKDFFQSLAEGDASGRAGELATRLGCDLDGKHLVVHVQPWVAPFGQGSQGDHSRSAPWPDRAAGIEAMLVASFPGVLVDTLERSIRAILPLRDGDATQVVTTIRDLGWGDASTADAPSIGVSNLCEDVGSFARGFEEAASSADIGALLRRGPGVTVYEDLGPYRYVLGTDNDLRDRSKSRLEQLVEYDARRGTQLLDTLEGYLDHRGNVVATSRVLFIHPNTLRQRLDRIERLTGLDLERSDWLSLAVATKVVKLRRMRRAAEGEGRNDG